MKTKTKSFTAKLLVLTVVPATLISILLFVVSANGLSRHLTQLSQERLRSIAVSLVESYDALYEGDWKYEGDILYKGNKDVSHTYRLLDNIREKNEVHCTIFFDNTRIMTTVKDENGERLEGTRANNDVIQTVLTEGKTYFRQDTMIDNTPYYAYYEPLKNSDGSVIGMMFTGITKAAVENMIRGIILQLLGAAVVFLAIDIVVVLMVSINMIKTIKSCAGSVEKIESGDLNAHARVGWFNKNDEISLLAEGINSMTRQFRDITGKIKTGTGLLHTTAQTMEQISDNTNTSILEVTAAIDEVAEGASKQADNTQNAVAHIEDMGISIEKIVVHMEELSRTAQGTQDTSKNADAAMEELLLINGRTKESIDDIVNQSEINVDAAGKIQEVVRVIADIASQTNLLSLNASIEAARAGEQGRGFAVVAGEIRTLAEQSEESAGEIRTIIEGLVASITETSKLTDRLENYANRQNDKLAATRKNFDGVVKNVNLMFEKTSVVSEEIGRIDELKDRISGMVESLSDISEENAAASEKTTAAAGVVAQLMEDLNNSIKRINELAEELSGSVSYFGE